MRKLEILLVDDIKDNLLALSSLLAKDSVTIFQASTGYEALELMMVHDFSVALLDVQMPGMNGFELAELMRGTNKTKNIPIIFVTALAKDEKYDFKGYESGAVDFLRKPLDPHTVKSKVNVFLQLHDQKLELVRQVEALKATREALEASVKVREEFLSIAGHELKTPLTSIKLQAQMRSRIMSKGGAATFTEEKLTHMFFDDNKQLSKLSRLIDDMMDVSRINTGKLSMQREQFDLCVLVRELLSKNFDVNEITLTSCESITGVWDLVRIEQVMTNLLTNAVRYGSGKPIHITVSEKNGFASVEIQDQGVGISHDDIGRVFKRYERATNSELSGLGLGLYIVSQILEAHRGSIKVESTVGEGSKFSFLLPLQDVTMPVVA